MRRKRSQNKIGGAVAADPGLAENTWEWERNKKWGKRDADAAAKEEQFRENIRALYRAGIDSNEELRKMQSVSAVFNFLNTSPPSDMLSKEELNNGFRVKGKPLTAKNLEMLWEISAVAHDSSDGPQIGVDQTSFEKIWSIMTKFVDRRGEQRQRAASALAESADDSLPLISRDVAELNLNEIWPRDVAATLKATVEKMRPLNPDTPLKKLGIIVMDEMPELITPTVDVHAAKKHIQRVFEDYDRAVRIERLGK